MKEQSQGGVQFKRRPLRDPQHPRPVRALPAEGFRQIQHHAYAGPLGLVAQPGVARVFDPRGCADAALFASRMVATGRRPSNRHDEAVQRHCCGVNVEPLVVELCLRIERI